MSASDKISSVTLYCYCVLLMHLIAYAVALDRFRRLDNLALSGSADSSLNTVSAIDCCMQCSLERFCNSVNFHLSSGLCELNIGRKLDFAGNTLVTRSGWRVYEREPCGLGYQSGQHCHHVIAPHKTWANAQSFCEDLGENLPEIRNVQEKDALVTDVMATGSTSMAYIWIGLNDETMTWSNGNPASYTFWEDTEPDGPEEQCVVFYINWSNYKWHDYGCTNTFSYVCQRRFWGPVNWRSFIQNILDVNEHLS